LRPGIGEEDKLDQPRRCWRGGSAEKNRVRTGKGGRGGEEDGQGSDKEEDGWNQGLERRMR
jgi:hypothetical protein